MTRTMALDVGDKRIGIAVSDLLGITAQGLETYERRSLEADLAHIKELCMKQNVSKIVCGFPKNMNGTIGPQAQKVSVFAKEVEEATGLPLVFVDERLTTVFAERALLEADVSRKKRRMVIDKLAAVTILQGYLDTNQK